MLAGALAGCCGAVFATEPTPRLVGEINYQTYPAVEAFLKAYRPRRWLSRSRLPIDNDETDGHLTTRSTVSSEVS